LRRIIDNDLMTLLSRLLIGGMFIVASFYKIIDPVSYAKSIIYYHIVPSELINLMALALPWLELLVGVALIVGVAYRGAVWWANLLLVVFVAALASTIARNLDIDCGCFKAGHKATGPAWDSLTFDVVAMIFSLQLLLSRSKRWRLGTRKSV
jgi:putative oxidoreductase